MAVEALPGARSIRLRIDRWDWTGWKFALPGLSVIAMVMGFPLIYAVLLAISSFTLLHPHLSPFVGWENFATVTDDEYFWHSVWLTIQYSSFTVIGEFLLGLLVALMLNRVVRLKAIYFAILTIPMAMSPVSVALIWHMLLQPNLGIINRLFEAAGHEGFDWLGGSRSGRSSSSMSGNRCRSSSSFSRRDLRPCQENLMKRPKSMAPARSNSSGI
jgi:multiple sugar transport system permease protein